MRVMLAGWQVSLHRTRADWPIVAAAGLITLLAAVLLAAGAIYPASAAEAGLRRALHDAPAGSTGVEAAVYAAPHAADMLDGNVQAELQAGIANVGGTVVRHWQSSATLAIAQVPGARDSDQSILGFIDAVSSHASVVAGTWPAHGDGTTKPIEVALVDAAAQELDLAVGDRFSLIVDRSIAPREVSVVLVGVFTIDEPADPFWNGDEQLISGLRGNASFRTIGPFLTTRDALVTDAGLSQLHLRWRLYPDFDLLTVDEMPHLRRVLESAQEHLHVASGEDFVVQSGLPAILGEAERSLLVSRTGVTLLMAQLALLAGYAVVLTATLLVDHRRLETALLRSRGAGPMQVAGLALVEGLLLAAPAVIVAPWLATAALHLLNVAGPLADVGLTIEPRVTQDSYVAAGLAGVACVLLLVLPAALAARGFAAEQGERSRQETRTFGQRMGLDIALLAVTGIALWQLRLYGAPLTRSVQGTLGLDPLLVAAPAIGLVAGAVLSLRMLPLLARAAERVATRGRNLVASMGSRQLARRPLRYTRSGLLLMLSMSMGVFALSYAATWSGSQRDQAAYQAGADIRVKPGLSRDALPAWALPAAYAGIPGIDAISPVERIQGGIRFAASGSVDVLALDARTAPGIVLVREDVSERPLDELLGVLAAGRTSPSLVSLPAGTTFLRVTPVLELTSAAEEFYDDETGEAHQVPLDPGTFLDARLGVQAVVRDATGLFYSVTSNTVPVDAAASAFILPLRPPGQAGSSEQIQADPESDGPLELVGLSVNLWLPDFTILLAGTVGVDSVDSGATTDGPWSLVPLDAAGAWRVSIANGRNERLPVTGSQSLQMAVQIGNDGAGLVSGWGTQAPAAAIDFVPASLSARIDPVGAIVNRAFLEETASNAGDTIVGEFEGRSVHILIAGVVESFPTTDPDRGLLLVDEPTLGLLRFLGAGAVRPADEWWLSAADLQTDPRVAALRASPFDSVSVVSAVDRTRSLSTDPVALGIIGALAVGFVATGLFALVGLIVSASVSARQRRTEFALLRALGLTGRQLSSSLWLENGSLVVVSLLAGTGLGVVIGWVVLPFVTVTQRATTPVPPVEVHVPWDLILLLVAVSALALGVAVIILGMVLRRLGVGSVLRMGED